MKISYLHRLHIWVVLPDEHWGKADVFVNDIISRCVDIGNGVERLNVIPCTVIHVVSSSAREESEIPRDTMIIDD